MQQLTLFGNGAEVFVPPSDSRLSVRGVVDAYVGGLAARELVPVVDSRRVMGDVEIVNTDAPFKGSGITASLEGFEGDLPERVHSDGSPVESPPMMTSRQAIAAAKEACGGKTPNTKRVLSVSEQAVTVGLDRRETSGHLGKLHFRITQTGLYDR